MRILYLLILTMLICITTNTTDTNKSVKTYELNILKYLPLEIWKIIFRYIPDNNLRGLNNFNYQLLTKNTDYLKIKDLKIDNHINNICNAIDNTFKPVDKYIEEYISNSLLDYNNKLVIYKMELSNFLISFINLMSLDLKNYDINKELLNLQDITKLTNLRALKLFTNEDLDRGPLPRLSGLSKLSHLTLKSIEPTEQEMKDIVNITSLKKLGFTCDFHNRIPDCLSKITYLDKLTLHIWSGDRDEENTDEIIIFITNSKAVDLTINNFNNLYNILQNLYNVKKLKMIDCDLSQKQIEKLSQLTNLTSLKLVEDYECVYENIDLCQMLGFLSKLTSLKNLTLTFADLNDKEKNDKINKLTEMTTLKHIDIN